MAIYYKIMKNDSFTIPIRMDMVQAVRHETLH